MNAFGKTLGTAAAYAKHGVVATALHAHRFSGDTVTSARAQYAVKDAELAVRREAIKAGNAAGAAAVVARRKPQRKLATA